MSGNISVTEKDGIALVTLDAPGEKVNILNSGFLRDLEKVAKDLRRRKDLAGAVVLSAKDGGFIAGADIGEIEGITDPRRGTELAREGQRILGLWSEMPFPVVAAIHGHCMGGGTEFVLACPYRIAAEDLALALPEVKLGIFPGFGGTQRLPRLISVEKSIDIILTGRTVRAGEALKQGLVDRVVPRVDLEREATALVREAARDGKRILSERKKKRGGLRAALLEKNPLGRAILFSTARKNALSKTRGHYPAPLTALEVIRRGLSLPLNEGLELEARELGPVMVSPVSKNLIHVFHLSQRPKKGAGVASDPSPVRHAAVLGAGVMGGGIAQLLASKNIPVTLKDIRQEAVDSGLAHARDVFRRDLARKGKEGEVEENMRRITGTTSYDGFGKADLVIEAIIEKMPAKQSVLREAEPHMAEAAVFATNTSALSVTELQSAALRPANVGGLHFFNPVDRMPLVEVIRGEKTSDRTVATLFSAALKLGKTPIIAADRPGFLVNRLLGLYLNEASFLAEEGLDWTTLDRAAKDFGLPMGPFRLIDEVGIDIAAEVGTTLSRSLPYVPECPLLRKAADAGLKGKKGGKGFYLHPEEGKASPNPSLDSGLGLRPGGRQANEEDLNRMLYLMVNEAARCLEEGVVGSPWDVDTGMVFGTGFPPFRGGLCRWADSQGLSLVRERLEKFAAAHGERFTPCGYLRERDSFY